MNTPNKLTIARVIMIPFFVAFLMYDITGAADQMDRSGDLCSGQPYRYFRRIPGQKI